MDLSFDRRTFLRRAALAALGAPVVTLGCSAGESGPLRGARGSGETLTRPILLPWGQDAVRIASPLSERPVGYMSTDRMELYVDHDFRDRLRYVLDAHISVSTGHWRIRRPGDSPLYPVQPGDALREYEEIDLREWDAGMEPSEGDVRIRRGDATNVRIEVSCTPLSGGDAWLSGEPLEHLQCGPPSDELCREDLMEVGTGTRFADRDCTRPIGPARFVTWACRDLGGA
jgi:hypothetical protein